MSECECPLEGVVCPVHKMTAYQREKAEAAELRALRVENAVLKSQVSPEAQAVLAELVAVRHTLGCGEIGIEAGHAPALIAHLMRERVAARNEAERLQRVLLKLEQWLEHAARLNVGGADKALQWVKDALSEVNS